MYLAPPLSTSSLFLPGFLFLAHLIIHVHLPDGLSMQLVINWQAASNCPEVSIYDLSDRSAHQGYIYTLSSQKIFVNSLSFQAPED